MQRPTSDNASPIRSSGIRKLVASAAVSLAAAVGIGALLPAFPASAALPVNTSSTHLGSYPAPATPPAYTSFTPVLTQTDGTTGRPAHIHMTGDAAASQQNLTFMKVTGSPSPEPQLLTTRIVGPAAQWYFQRIGYVGVMNSWMDPQGSVRLATPVYRIINYSLGSPQCLTSRAVLPPATPVVDAPVTASACLAPGAPGDTDQLWLIGSPGLQNALLDINTGNFAPGAGFQEYSPGLQRQFVGGTPDYQHSVIENYTSLVSNSTNYDVVKTPVLSAEFHGTDQGDGSTLALRGQTESLVSVVNSTWNLTTF
jgi:hypothetical protein